MRKMLFALLFLAPLSAAAAVSTAGFSAQSLFLSRSSVTEGETVTAYTNVINNSDALFAGSIAFSAGGKEIGSQSISLPAGEAEVVSTSWQPSVGTYKVTATLYGPNNKSLAAATADLSVAEIVHNGGSQSTSTIESSAAIASTISHYVPQIASATTPALNAVDGFRATTVKIIDSQLAATKPKLPGMIPGSATSSAPHNPTGWALGIVWTLYFYVVTILRAIMASVALFYPILAFLFVYILYKLYRRLSRPKYNY